MHRPQDDVVPLHEPFETALRGFNRQQVLAHIESLEGQISMVTADRESALAQVAELSRSLEHLRQESKLLAHLRRETEKVNEQVELMAQRPIVGASVRIQRIVRLAEEEAADLKDRTQKEVDELWARTEREITALRERAEREITAQREHATGQAEALLQDTTQRCKQLEADSEQRCKAAEQHAEQEIARKESEANDRIQRRDQRGLAGLLLMLRVIGPHLAQRVAVVQRQEAELAELRARTDAEVNALEALRATITAQLSTTRQVLAEALEQIQQSDVDGLRPVQPMPNQRESSPPVGSVAEEVPTRTREVRTEERLP